MTDVFCTSYGGEDTLAPLRIGSRAAGAISAQFYVSCALAKGGLSLSDVTVVNGGGLPDETTTAAASYHGRRR
jgi:ABC-type nitrate/sulfonate/bicarbonate transport system substrate-binding protein